MQQQQQLLQCEHERQREQQQRKEFQWARPGFRKPEMVRVKRSSSNQSELRPLRKERYFP
nr:MAG TPA: hypothetical protein [Caudoviricetes sp.]